MAITNLVNDLIHTGVLRLTTGLKDRIEGLLDALQDDERYNPEFFRSQLAALKREAVGMTP